MNKFVLAVRRAVATVHDLFDSEAAFLTWVADIKRPTPSQDAALKLQALINKLDGRWLQGLLFSGDREEARSLAAEGVIEAIRTERPGAHASRFEFASALANILINNVLRKYNKDAGVRAHPEFDIAEAADGNATAHPKFDEKTRKYIDELVKRHLSKRSPKNEVADPDAVIRVKNAWAAAIRKVDESSARASARVFSTDVVIQVCADTGLAPNVVVAAMRRLTRSLRTLDEPTDALDRTDLGRWLAEDDQS